MLQRPRSSRSTRSLAVVIAAAGGLALAVPTAAFASTGHHGSAHGRDSHGSSHGNQSHGNDNQGNQSHGQENEIGGKGPQNVAVQQSNLVSDVPGMAKLTDPDLVNPWGLALNPTSPLWSANAGSDTATLYSLPPASNNVAKVPTVRVTMPTPPGLPTGQVANTGTGFQLSSGAASGPAAFIFSTITGRIEAWSPKVDPLLGDAETKATVPGAVYTGLAMATTQHGDQLYAANFGQGRIDVFDSSFKQVKTTPSQFRDPRMPKGYVPFNAQTLNGNVYVTYDKPNASGTEEVGKGIGFVDEYTPDGRLVGRVLSGGDLNAPWGLAIAPPSWGKTAGSLLVGNFGDGKINVVAKDRHGFENHIQGQVVNKSTGKPFAEPGLWALTPGTATTGGSDAILFSAGIDGEQHGLLGILRVS